MSEPAAILPRGPVRRARQVAGAVLSDAQNPFESRLTPHPGDALRRRLWWATGLTLSLGGALTWLAVTGVIPYEAIWAAVALWAVEPSDHGPATLCRQRPSTPDGST